MSEPTENPGAPVPDSRIASEVAQAIPGAGPAPCRPNGWAVVSRRTLKPGDPSTGLCIIPVREHPGACGPLIPARGRAHPITYGVVVRTRREARAAKQELAEKMGLAILDAQDHYDPVS